jgi:hypothetical protein
MKQEITCPKCSYKFALDEALNRDIELQVRTQLSEEFKKKEGELRRQLSQEATEKAERNSAELQSKVEAQAKELKEARDKERALLHKKAELEERAEKAQLEAQRSLADGREKIRKAAQDQVLEEHRPVARLSVITTESSRTPAALPAGEAFARNTRLGCPRRATLLEIIATMVCSSPVPRLSRWRTNAGRRLAVRRSELGKRTNTTSPRRVFIVDGSFGSIPVFGKRL